MTPFYQIGWSDSHRRDLRLEIDGTMSAPIVRIARHLANGDVTYINLLMGEAVRLYNALGQFIYGHQQCEKQYREPDKSHWSVDGSVHPEDEEDDPLGSD